MQYASLTDNQIQLIHQGNLDILIQYDKQGFILGQEESLRDYAKRIQQFQQNNQQLQEKLTIKKHISIENLTVHQKDKINSSFFLTAQNHTNELYGFSIKNISGFFVNLGLFFGGCAYIFPNKFFSLFFIKKSFKKKKKWLIYERDEIFAHEFCHIARFALNSNIFEEIFAYQTSKSKFRKYFASFLQKSSDTFIIISSIILTIIGQIIDYFYPPFLWLSSFKLWTWILFINILIYFLSRHFYNFHLFNRAIKKLSNLTPHPLALAFRLSDEEIIYLSKNKISAKKFNKLISSKNKIRLKVLSQQFL